MNEHEIVGRSLRSSVDQVATGELAVGLKEFVCDVVRDDGIEAVGVTVLVMREGDAPMVMGIFDRLYLRQAGDDNSPEDTEDE